MSDEGFLVGREEARRLASELRKAEARPINSIPPEVPPGGVGLVGFLGVLEDELEYRATANFEIWAGDPLKASGVILECEDWFLKVSESLDADSRVLVINFSGVYYVVASPCE